MIFMKPNSSDDAANMKSSDACGSQYDFWTPWVNPFPQNPPVATAMFACSVCQQ